MKTSLPVDKVTIRHSPDSSCVKIMVTCVTYRKDDSEKIGHIEAFFDIELARSFGKNEYPRLFLYALNDKNSVIGVIDEPVMKVGTTDIKENFWLFVTDIPVELVAVPSVFRVGFVS